MELVPSGNTDLILSRLRHYAFPLEWRCPEASMTMLHYALLGGDVRLVKRLLEAGSDVHARNAFGYMTTCLALMPFSYGLVDISGVLIYLISQWIIA